VHPAALTFKLPNNVPMDWGAMVEPLAVGMHACTKARVKPGDVVCCLRRTRV
jgi:D-xylulose reductase